MKTVFVLFALFLVAAQAQQLSEGGKIWAVLVAGSNTWGNYRHQADVCHAYQVLHNHGIPDEQIIVMMFDDIANNPENPTPGIVINHPNGSDVYHGVPKDYIKTSVTPDVFKSVLTGDEQGVQGKGSGKVLKSGPNDHVFINFVDHGAFGLIAFPFQEMHASELLDILNTMNQKQMYGKLTFYMEACESGSMFLGLPPNVNIYATTAADAIQSSYACYYDFQRRTYLGDVYSVNWMENSDANDLTSETLLSQYDTVKNLTTTSQVMQYGEVDIDTLVVGQFQGMAQTAEQQSAAPQQKDDAVPSDNVHLEILKRQLELSTTDEETRDIAIKINHLLSNRDQLKRTIKTIVQKSVHNTARVESVLNRRLEFHISNRPCYEAVVKHFSRKCYPLSQNSFAMKQMYVFANMCELNVHPGTVKAAMDSTCQQPIINVH